MSHSRSKKSAHNQELSTASFFKAIGYSFGKNIGQGTYSKVCTASDKNGKVLACKIINKSKAGREFIEKFLPRELSIICSIKHDHIVSVYKVLEVNNVIYMFMDFCKNGDLLEFIRIHGNLSEKKAKHFFRQIVDAVYFLHRLDIAHRDLKCENVFLMEDHKIKLGDFGFARNCKNCYGEMLLSNTFCGSAAYAAPEILQGICYEPKKYDMWALGCILYIMLAASMPFDDTNIKKMVEAQLNSVVNTVTLSWRKHSDSLKLLLSQLLEPDSNIRITIKEVLNSLWLMEGTNKTKTNT